MTRPYLTLAALAAFTLLTPATHAQTLTLNSGDTVTVNGTGTHGTIGGTPVNNTTTTYTITTTGTAIFSLGTGGTSSGYGYGLTVKGSGPIAITGGTVSASVYTFYDTGSSPVTISGGTFTAGYFGYAVNTNSASSSVAITGGSFTVQSGGYDLFNQSGSIDLYGMFNGLTLGQTQILPTGSSSFTGTLVNNTVPQAFSYSNSGTITLHDIALAPAPEPSPCAAFAVGLLGLGTLMVRAKRRTA